MRKFRALFEKLIDLLLLKVRRKSATVQKNSFQPKNDLRTTRQASDRRVNLNNAWQFDIPDSLPPGIRKHLCTAAN